MYLEDVIKIIGIGLTALVIVILLKQYKPELSIYISIIAGILILFLTIDKITGIAFLSEFATSVCIDSGEKAIASKIEIGTKVIIITMSMPIITELLELIVEILPWKREFTGGTCGKFGINIRKDTYEKNNYNNNIFYDFFLS